MYHLVQPCYSISSFIRHSYLHHVHHIHEEQSESVLKNTSQTMQSLRLASAYIELEAHDFRGLQSTVV